MRGDGPHLEKIGDGVRVLSAGYELPDVPEIRGVENRDGVVD